jgi:hypothetical protein
MSNEQQQHERELFWVEMEIQKAHNRLTCIHHLTPEQIETEQIKLHNLQQDLEVLKMESNA